MHRRSSIQPESGTSLLLASPFFLSGFAAFVLMYWNTFDAYRMKRWDSATASIKKVELKTTSNSKGGHSRRVVATYEYKTDGKTRVGQRVGIHNWGSDNMGQWQGDTASRLKKHMRSREPHVCYVNPNNPDQAVLDRELRLPLILLQSWIALLFGGAGLAIGLESLRSNGQIKQHSRVQASGKPWQSRPEWATGVIESQPIKTLRWALPTSLFFFMTLLPGMLLMPREMRAGNSAAFLILIGPGILLIFLLKCFGAIRRQLSEGTTIAQLADTPGIIGGPLSGIIRTKQDLHASTGVRISLRCEKATWTSSGKSKSHRMETIWRTQQEIVADLTPGVGDGSAIPFDFAIPHELPQTHEGDEKVRWLLHAESIGKGPQFEMECEVPVFITDESSESYAEHSQLLTEFETELAPRELLSDYGADIASLPGGQKKIRIRGQKTLGSMMLLLAFTAAFALASIAAFRTGVSWWIGIPTGFTGFFLTWSLLHTLLWECKIVVSPDTATIRSGATFLCGTHRVALPDFAGLSTEMGTQYGSNTWFKVYFQTIDGPDIQIGKGILHEANANSYAKAIWHEVVGKDPPEVKTRTFSQRKKKFEARKNRRK